jgi:hypothetical protein
MNVEYIIFDADGRIRQVGLAPEEVLSFHAQPGLNIALGSVNKIDETYMVTVVDEDTGEASYMPAQRPENPAIYNDGAIKEVPVAGTLVVDNGEQHPLPAGDSPLIFTDIGTYQLKLQCWPYKDKTIEVTI